MMEKNHYEETIKTWDELADLYDAKFMDLSIYNKTYDDILNLLQEDQKSILDIGCGPGNIIRYLSKAKPSLKITGIDRSASMLKIAARYNPHARFIQMDARHIQQLTDQYDVIISGFCIPYLNHQDCEKWIGDCGSLQSASGLFYLSFVVGSHHLSGFQRGSSGKEIFFHYYEEKFVKNLLEAQNYKILQSTSIPYTNSQQNTENHLILLAQKMP